MAEFRPQIRRWPRSDPPADGHRAAPKGNPRPLFHQGFLVYSVKPRKAAGALGFFGGGKKLNLEKFLIFNQQFVTLIRAGLPILKSLDLLAERLTDPKLEPYIKAVRDEVRNGTLLSDAFRQQGIFPKIYVSSVMAGEKSGSLTEVLDRYIHYQKLSLAVRKKVMVSLMYPCVLIVLVSLLMVFLVTYVVPTFASLYSSMQATLPPMTELLIAIGTTARSYILGAVGALIVGHLRIPLVGQASGRARTHRPRQDEGPDRGRYLAEVSGGAAFAHPEHAAHGWNSAGAGLGNRRRFAGHAAVAKSASKRRQSGSRRPTALGIAQGAKNVPAAGHRYDRGRRIHRRVARNAEQRRRILRRGREHAHAGRAFAH